MSFWLASISQNSAKEALMLAPDRSNIQVWTSTCLQTKMISKSRCLKFINATPGLIPSDNTDYFLLKLMEKMEQAKYLNLEKKNYS